MSPPRSLETAFQDARRHLRAGQFAAAISLCREALQKDSKHASFWHLLGVCYLQIGEAGPAVDAIQHAISLDETRGQYHNNLGVALLAQDDWKQAKQAFARAIAIDARNADAIANLGLVSSKLGDIDDAAIQYRQALRIQPRHIDASFNLANLLFEEGKATEAISLYQFALKAGSQRADILNNLGRAFLETGNSNEAFICFERALAVDPNCAEASFNAGKVHAQHEDFRKAKLAFTHAFRLRQNKRLWRLQELGLCPTVFQSVAELDEYRAELENRLDKALQAPLHVEIDELAWDGFVPSFNLAHHGRSNRRLFEKFAAIFGPHIPKRNPPSVSKKKKRVGFLVTAPHVGSFLRMQGGIVEHLDPERFEVVVCCTDSAIAKLRQGIRRHDVTWVPFSRRFSDAVKTIVAASCDVLYFHKVSSDPLGYLLPFARLAPVQCTSWTTHFTSGVAEVDYYLSSALVEAPDAEREYTERLVRFETAPGFERQPCALPPCSRGDFGLPGQGSLYLCPQRLAKFHPAQDELFRQVLDQDSTGTLVMLAGNNRMALEQLLHRFQRTLGTAAKRIVVLPLQSAVNLLQLMSVCDALLDIRHYSVSLMAKDACAVGLPIVSLPGKFKVERYTQGFYRKLGIPDLIAASADDYVRLAVRLGKDADFRRNLHHRILANNHCLYEDRQAVLEFERFAETC